MKIFVRIVRHLNLTKLMLILFLSIFVSLEASAVPQNISFQSKIYKPDGSPLEAPSVQFKFSVMNPISTCIIYAETFSNIDLTGTGGSVVLTLGGPGAVTDYNDGGAVASWYDAFNNATATYNCRTSGTYSPGIIDTRRIVMQFYDGTPVGWQTLPPIDINSVPFAMFAQTAETVSSVAPSIITAGGASVGQVLKWSGTNWVASADNSGGGSSALTSANIFVGNASNLAEGRVLSGDATIDNAGTLSLLNTSTARSNLGLGGAAVLNVGTGAGTVAAGNDSRFTDSRAPVGAASGDLSGAYPAPTLAVIGAGGTSSKVTFDTKGRIISSAALVSTDITTALTYTPANGANYVAKIGDSMSGVLNIMANSASADLSVTQTGAGPAATFMGGSVGIGTTTPGQKLEVAGTIYSTSGGFQFPDATVQTSAARTQLTGTGLPSTSAAGATVYSSFGFGSPNATEANKQLVIAAAGTISKFYIVTSTAQPGTGNFVMTIRKNGVDTAVSLTIAPGAAAGVYSDTTNSVAVSAGDLISISFANAAATNSAAVVSFSALLQ